jgi:hypothetical protein
MNLRNDVHASPPEVPDISADRFVFNLQRQDTEQLPVV